MKPEKPEIKKPSPAEIEGKDFLSPEKSSERLVEETRAANRVIDLILNDEAEVEVRKTKNGKYKSLSIFKIDRETGNKKELLVYFDNFEKQIGPFEQKLWALGVEPKYIIEP